MTYTARDGFLPMSLSACSLGTRGTAAQFLLALLAMSGLTQPGQSRFQSSFAFSEPTLSRFKLDRLGLWRPVHVRQPYVPFFSVLCLVLD